jgi:NADH dehydrogenase
MPEKKHIVIIGAGFAGLRLARELNNHVDYSITLIDRNNYHQFQPLLYQVATANLDASNISFPLRTIFRQSKNVRICVAEVKQINLAEQQLDTSVGPVHFDYLVIATGAETNYFGNASLRQFAFPMKSTVEALQLRNQLIQNLEHAALSTDQAHIESLLSIVVVGGGPTGIELSGALAEMKKDTLPGDYPELDVSGMNIYLLEAGKNLLGNMSEHSSITSRQYLEKMGVIVKTNTLVKDYDGKRVLLQDGTGIPCSLVIWAAGVMGTAPQGLPAECMAPGNRIKVNEWNQVIGTEHLFAIGDIALMSSPDFPKGYPQLASVAIDQARNLATNFERKATGKERLKYRYRNKGTMATVGRNKAVVDLSRPSLSFRGYLAWFIWMSVHLFLLMGFKNRIIVFINWIYKYFTRNQSLSLLFSSLFRNRSDTPR